MLGVMKTPEWNELWKLAQSHIDNGGGGWGGALPSECRHCNLVVATALQLLGSEVV